MNRFIQLYNYTNAQDPLVQFSNFHIFIFIFLLQDMWPSDRGNEGFSNSELPHDIAGGSSSGVSKTFCAVVT